MSVLIAFFVGGLVYLAIHSLRNRRSERKVVDKPGAIVGAPVPPSGSDSV
jgi:hypothetical protein